MFANRVVRYIGSYVAELNGLDALVFTAGSGENGIGMRERIANQIGVFGVNIDHDKNQVRGKETIISPDGAKVKVMVVPTNEELEIVRDVTRLTTPHSKY